MLRRLNSLRAAGNLPKSFNVFDRDLETAELEAILRKWLGGSVGGQTSLVGRLMAERAAAHVV
jgi:hypothetical protein